MFDSTIGKIFHLLMEWKEQQQKQHEEDMIAQASLDASLASLTIAVNNAASALATANTQTSTPDAVVAAYQAGVDAQTVALAAATPPVATPPSVSLKH